MSEIGLAAARVLAVSGQVSIAPGLTDAEISAVEARFGFTFDDDHRAFLAAGLPTGRGWPDWRGDDTALIFHVGWPARDLLRAVKEDGFWGVAWGERPDSEYLAIHEASRMLGTAPRMVPVFRQCYLPAGRGGTGSPVWLLDGADVSHTGKDLHDFVARLCGGPAEPVKVQAPLAFWSDLLPGAEKPPPPEYPALGAPPFEPDPAVEAPAAVRPPADPVAAFAVHGVELAEASRHDGVLAHGGPLWTVPVTPGDEAARLWAQTRVLFPETGLWPVLITARTWHRIGGDGVEDPALWTGGLDGAAWLEREYRSYTEHNDDLPRAEGVELIGLQRTHWRQTWSEMDDTGRFDRLALVPTPASWYVPALLQWSGAVNYDITGSGHTAVLRRWAGRFDAHVAALDDESMVLRVNQPPRLPPAMRSAALEAFLYCVDSVLQGSGSIDALANRLGFDIWNFWWD